MKKNIFLILALFMINVIYAQTGFSDAKLIFKTEAHGLSSIDKADLNNDGHTDVLSASRLDNKIAWYKNLGGGKFSRQIIISNTATAAAVVTAADLNQDGLTDVIAASNSTAFTVAELYWFENLGNGTFSNAQHITDSLDNIKDITIADFDNDGVPDILTASYFDNKIAWFKNDGNGNFSNQKIVTTSAMGVQFALAADMDGDQKTDIISWSKLDKSLRWFKNTGGSFANPVIISDSLDDIKDIKLHDLDNDGDQDIYFVDQTKIAWYKNSGNGIFQGPDTVIVDTLHNNGGIEARDVDGNGLVDIIYVTDTLGFYPNNGSGFGNYVMITDSISSGSLLISADFAGDSLPDVVLGTSDLRITFYENKGGGVFGSQYVLADFLGHSVWGVHAADVSGDGNPDVIAAADCNSVSWYENDGNGNFGPPNSLNLMGKPSTDVQTADLNNDGNLDVISSSAGHGEILWYQNKGNGKFSPPITISDSIFYPWRIYPADLNNDSYPDVLSASSHNNGRVVWFENDGNGNFINEHNISIPSFSFPYGIFYPQVYDLNGDNLNDIIISLAEDGKLIWLAQTDPGHFSGEQIITANLSYPQKVEVAFINNDTFPDLVVSHQNGVNWYENDGMGNFQSHVVYSGPIKEQGIEVADFDNNGTADIVLNDNNNYIVKLNDGQANFTTITITSYPISPTSFSLCSADLDNDGRIDLVHSNTTSIEWFTNLGVTGISSHSGVSAKVFPNPTSDKITISSPEIISAVRVTNASGQEVLHKDGRGGKLVTLSLSRLERGIYFAEVFTDNSCGIVKIVKE